MRRVARKEGLEPLPSIEIGGEGAETLDDHFHLWFHRVDVLEDRHLQEADFLTHKTRKGDRWAIPNLYLRKETSAEL